MNINTLTIKAQEALQAALTLARERGQQAVDPLHLLSVLICEDDSLGTFLLGRVGVNVRGLREEVNRAVGTLPRVAGSDEQYFSQDASRVIQRAVDFTKNFGDKYASVEHLLLGLLAERGEASDLLKRSGASEKELIEAIRTFRKGGDRRFADCVAGVRRPGQVRHQPQRTGVRRTTRSSLVSRVRARRLSSKDWPSVSCVATCPRT